MQITNSFLLPIHFVTFVQVMVNKSCPVQTGVINKDQAPSFQETPISYRGPIPSMIEKVRFIKHILLSIYCQ